MSLSIWCHFHHNSTGNPLVIFLRRSNMEIYSIITEWPIVDFILKPLVFRITETRSSKAST